MYARVHNIINVGGRRNYVTNKSKEELVGFFDTAKDGFWRLLAKENQEQFLRSSNAKQEKAKASEAREIVFGLPPYANDPFTATLLAQQVKIKLGVECMVGIHKKWTRNKSGDRVLNLHAHIIFAERTLLDEAIHVEEKRAERTYYYDAAGKKCKKADAVKVTKKGAIIQEECIRRFSNKINFFNIHKSINPLLDSLAKQFRLDKFDITRHFPQRKIGKHNSNEEYITEHNELIKTMNAFFDDVDADRGTSSAKAEFCEKYSVPQRFGVNQTDVVRKKFEAFRLEFEVSEEDLRHELEVLRAAAKEFQTEIDKTEAILQVQPGDFAGEKIAEIYRRELESKYSMSIDWSFLEYLKEKLREILEIIAAIIKKLGDAFSSRTKENHQKSETPNPSCKKETIKGILE